MDVIRHERPLEILGFGNALDENCVGSLHHFHHFRAWDRSDVKSDRVELKIIFQNLDRREESGEISGVAIASKYNYFLR